MQDFLYTFLPLFIAIDAIATVPIITSLSEGMASPQRLRMVHLAVITATIVGLIFLFAGKFLLQVLGITIAHFAIAGGLVLLALSLRDLVMGQMVEMPLKDELIAVVPIGTPLTVGPATLTTLLLLSGEYGVGVVLFSFALNMVVAWLFFLFAGSIAHFLGLGGLRAVSKVMSLILAAIAVRMIVRGLLLVFPALA